MSLADLTCLVSLRSAKAFSLISLAVKTVLARPTTNLWTSSMIYSYRFLGMGGFHISCCNQFIGKSDGSRKKCINKKCQWKAEKNYVNFVAETPNQYLVNYLEYTAFFGISPYIWFWETCSTIFQISCACYADLIIRGLEVWMYLSLKGIIFIGKLLFFREVCEKPVNTWLGIFSIYNNTNQVGTIRWAF